MSAWNILQSFAESREADHVPLPLGALSYGDVRSLVKDSGPGGGLASPPAAAGAGLISGPGEGNQREGNPAGPGIPIAEHAALQDQLLGEIAAHQELDGQVALLLRRLRQRNETIAFLTKSKLTFAEDDTPERVGTRIYYDWWVAARKDAQYYEMQFVAVCNSHKATNKGYDRLTRQLEKLGRKVAVLRARLRHADREEAKASVIERVLGRALRLACDKLDDKVAGALLVDAVLLGDARDVQKAFK